MMGILHPGEMGSVVGGVARAGGARVWWVSAGRGSATRARAEAEGLEDAGTLARLVGESEVILSVCPPHAALALAREVGALRFRGTFVDCNAVSPATARTIASAVEAEGAAFVDGGLIGPPPRRPGTTRLYLAGARAPRVTALFAGTPLEAIVLDAPPPAASALKMAYAAWTKGSGALLAAVRVLAIHERVDEALLAEWRRSLPDLPGRSGDAVTGNARKAWRFVGEMEEIAATFEAAGLPAGFHQAAAEIYRRLASWKDAPAPPTVEEAAKALAP